MDGYMMHSRSMGLSYLLGPLGWDVSSMGSVPLSSVAQSCPTLCNPMDCSTPGRPVHHQLSEFTQTHVHWISDAIQPSHPLSSPSPPTFNLSQHQGFFQMSQFFESETPKYWSQKLQSIGVSASVSVLPMNIQDWFPLGWTGWISLQSKGLSRVFSNTTIQKHQVYGLSFGKLIILLTDDKYFVTSIGPILRIEQTLWKAKWRHREKPWSLVIRVIC